MKIKSYPLPTDRDQLLDTLAKGVTLSRILADSASAQHASTGCWAEACRYASESPDRLEVLCSVVAAQDGADHRKSLYAGARRAIKTHADAVCIIASRKTDTGADGYTVREFSAAEAAASANAAADKREATAAAKAAAEATAAAKAARDASIVAQACALFGCEPDSIIPTLMMLQGQLSVVPSAAAAA